MLVHDVVSEPHVQSNPYMECLVRSGYVPQSQFNTQAICSGSAELRERWWKLGNQPCDWMADDPSKGRWAALGMAGLTVPQVLWIGLLTAP